MIEYKINYKNTCNLIFLDNFLPRNLQRNFSPHFIDRVHLFVNKHYFCYVKEMTNDIVETKYIHLS